MARQALRGIQQALQPVGALSSSFNGYGDDPEPDPLGIRLQTRAMDDWWADKAERARTNPGFDSGPIPQPNQEGLLQALKETGAKVGHDLPGSSIEQDPAGMTHGHAMADAQAYGKGGALPDWYGGATGSTQDAFRSRVLKGIKTARV